MAASFKQGRPASRKAAGSDSRRAYQVPVLGRTVHGVDHLRDGADPVAEPAEYHRQPAGPDRLDGGRGRELASHFGRHIGKPVELAGGLPGVSAGRHRAARQNGTGADGGRQVTVGSGGHP